MIPLQDAPGVKFTYEATVTVPAPLVVLTGPEGSGTTSAAAQIATAGDRPPVWCRLAPGYDTAADLVEQDLRHLRRLAAARVAHDHRHAVVLHHREDLPPLAVRSKVLRVGHACCRRVRLLRRVGIPTVL